MNYLRQFKYLFILRVTAISANVIKLIKYQLMT